MKVVNSIVIQIRDDKTIAKDVLTYIAPFFQLEQGVKMIEE